MVRYAVSGYEYGGENIFVRKEDAMKEVSRLIRKGRDVGIRPI